MVSSRQRGGSITLWAWTVSVVVHLIFLTAFGIVKFSRSKAQGEHRPTPTAKVRQIRKLIRAVPIIPKPKVKKASVERFAKSTDRLLPISQILDVARAGLQKPVKPGRPAALQSALLLPSSGKLAHKSKFFGSFTEHRKVCYLVDCSGSMGGVFGRVRKSLKESIEDLQPDQYFYIIFFGGDKLFEFGGGRLIRATQKARSAAYDFIDSIHPAGQTNAMAALERVVQIRDDGGVSPSTIYFLTDGFELTTENKQRFSQKIANLQKRFAPMTKINTIGFWPQSSDRKMLEAIARQSGGEFVFVADADACKDDVLRSLQD